VKSGADDLHSIANPPQANASVAGAAAAEEADLPRKLRLWRKTAGARLEATPATLMFVR